jgi:hypothetical protein
MWKIFVAFLLFAAAAMWLLSKGGDIDISGEKHGAEVHAPAADKQPEPAKDAAPAKTDAAPAEKK